MPGMLHARWIRPGQGPWLTEGFAKPLSVDASSIKHLPDVKVVQKGDFLAVVGKVDGVPRVVLEHITRTDPEQVPEWEKPPEGADGCYRIRISGEPMMNVDFTHHGEHGDHNVSGMITTAMRLVNAAQAVPTSRWRFQVRTASIVRPVVAM